MVRLVFRPYTQVWRSICTSESLQTSTRVSSGFILPRHSSPSFGYHRIRSSSTISLIKEVGRPLLRLFALWAHNLIVNLFSLRLTGLNKTVRLAYLVGSLVRVSRRVGWRPTYSHHNLRKSLIQSTPMTIDTTSSLYARRHKSAKWHANHSITKYNDPLRAILLTEFLYRSAR